MSSIWLISVSWADTSFVDFLVRSSSQSTTKLDIYRWFFTHIHQKIPRFDYSPLANIEGDLDLLQILNKDIEHENLNVHDFEDFTQLNLNEIELFMRENGKAHGMVVTVSQAKEKNYHIINIDDDSLSMIWKVTYNPRFLDCISPDNLPSHYDIQQNTRSNYLWQIRARQEHHVYQYIFKNLNLFYISNLPQLMNKSQDDLIRMVEFPLEQIEHRIVSDMINTQCCQIRGEHQHNHPEEQTYAILVEPALNLLDIVDI